MKEKKKSKENSWTENLNDLITNESDPSLTKINDTLEKMKMLKEIWGDMMIVDVWQLHPSPLIKWGRVYICKN